MEGVRFGAVMGLLIGAYTAGVNYGIMRIGKRMALTYGAGWLGEWLLVGLAIGLVYKPVARTVRRAAGVQNRDICRRERYGGNHARGREDSRRNAGGGGADIGLDEIVGSPEAAGHAQGGEHIVACEALPAGAAIGIVPIHAVADVEVQQTG